MSSLLSVKSMAVLFINCYLLIYKYMFLMTQSDVDSSVSYYHQLWFNKIFMGDCTGRMMHFWAVIIYSSITHRLGVCMSLSFQGRKKETRKKNQEILAKYLPPQSPPLRSLILFYCWTEYLFLFQHPRYDLLPTVQ